ncbi:TonB-dependent receptor [Putridiphycobacter roseus]|uniref:TonB-dependent receptor n=1 Tax=Putridiphycobacter roseus TaxID=2219161 RepID=A0A2W1MZ82_9FLAO|nr:TonB-dependent receptor [Putridiphycobacter roseus]PZE16560.1 TonB-dependent receptor [Putridiphycobacter roseus]
MNKILLFFLFLAHITCTYGQNEGQLFGKITDSITQKAVPFAHINITGTSRYFISDLNGSFTINKIEQGNISFTIIANGYDTLLKRVKFNTTAQQFNFTLNPSKNYLKLVTVDGGENTSAIRKLRAIEGVLLSKGKKSEVINMNKITGNKSANIGRQIYARIPGLNIWESDGAGIQLGIGGRGLSPTRTSNFNTRQDGYDISADALGYPESYYTPPSEAVKEIQLIRGAASLQFGTQFGGLLNFVLKKGNENKPLEVTARHTLGSFGLNSSFVSVGGSKNTWNYYAYYQYKFGDDWKAYSSFKVHNAGLKIEKHLSEKMKISIGLTKMYYIAMQPGGLTDFQFENDPSIVNRKRNWFEVDWNLAAFNFDYEFDARTRINSRFFGLLATRNSTGYLGQINRIDPNESRDLIAGQFKNFGNETRFLKIYDVKKMTWAYLFGFRLYQGYNESQQGLTSAGDQADFSFLNPATVDGSLYTFPSQNLAIFSEHIFNLTPRFSITPGLRFEYINTTADGVYREQIEDLAGNIIFDSLYQVAKDNERSFVIGGLGLNYHFSDSLELYTNFSQNYRSINFTDMQIVNPNFKIDPNLQDEKGFNFDIGVKGNIQHKINYDISAFVLLYNNRIGTTIQVDSVLFTTYQYRTNISKSITKGIEAVVEADLYDLFIKNDPAIDLNVFVNASYVNAIYYQSEQAAFENKKVELVPPINLKTGLTFTHHKFTASYQYSYTAAQFSDATNSLSQANAVNGIIPAYQIHDLSFKYSYKRFQIETGINNFLNEKYFTRRATAYPGPGIIPAQPRNYFVTLQFKI